MAVLLQDVLDGGYDSVVAEPPVLNYDEAVIYSATQAIPSYVVVYDS